AINNLNFGSNLLVGGISGKSLGAFDLKNSYFAGKIQHSCTTSCEVGDIVGGGTAPVFANNGVHIDSATTTSNVDGTNIYAFSEIDLTNESATNSRNTHFPSPAWVLNDGVYPRLVAELPDACVGDSLLSITSQMANGRGSSAEKPIVICNRGQFLSISGNNFYKLGTDLNVGPLTQNQTLTLDGELNGDHRRLLNISLAGSGAGDIGLFERINSTGAVKKLWIEGSVQGSTSQDRTGLLAGKNLGTIEDVVVEGSIFVPFTTETPSTFHSVGLVAGFNSGTIKEAQAFGVLSSKLGVGGLVGNNLGEIKLSQARTEIRSVGDVASELGGLVATNSGTIEQCLSESTIDTLVNGSASASHFGGLVAINQAGGVIENSYASEDSRISVATSPYIGGLAGENLGAITKSYSLTKSFVNGTFQSMQGGLVGDSSGSVSDSFYYFEPISEIGTVWEPDWSTPSCTGSTFQVTVNNSNIDYGYSGSELLELRGSSSTEYMRVVSGVSFGGPGLFSQSVDACATNMSFNDIVAYAEAPGTIGGSRVTSYTNLFAQATYTNWDIVLDNGGTSMDPRLVDFYTAEVNDQEHVNPPIWTLMPGEPPRLLQVKN
ncbi:MAG: hypothetical protein KC478_05605, partial [Bacteriovoracaceae bacterium]|nr:hypothetical protein [Bacteriovoracaceae bacterium]